MNKGTSIVGFILCFLAGSMFMYGVDHRQGAGAEADSSSSSPGSAKFDDSASPVPVTDKDPVWGNRNAPVTIVEFSDFQCPFCSRVEATMEQVKTTYGKDKVRVIWKNEPARREGAVVALSDEVPEHLVLCGNRLELLERFGFGDRWRNVHRAAARNRARHDALDQCAART